MDIGGFHIPSIVSASGTFASIYGAFSRFDRIQSRTNRKFVSAWLKGLKAPQTEWSAFFLEIFERFFGAKHFSLKCLSRSLLLSAFLMLFASAVTIAMSNANWHMDAGLAEAFLFSALAGCITDYLSLWKTRAILTRFDPIRKRLTVAGLLAVDFVGTTIIYLLCWFPILLLLVWDEHGELLDPFVMFPSFFQTLGHALRTGKLFDPELVYYWVALLTSAWLWMYVIVSQMLRVASYAPAFVNALSKVADLNEHPVRTIGFIVAAASAVIVGILSAL